MTNRRGDAFNRLEVGSAYVGAHDRYICCFIVGFPDGTEGEAAKSTLAMTAQDDTIIMVFDRATGEMREMTVGQVKSLP